MAIPETYPWHNAIPEAPRLVVIEARNAEIGSIFEICS
jgi:hypothetical protein